jgi:hypothetical protein
LRTAGGPLVTREITGRLMTRKGLDPADGRTRELVHKTGAATLTRLGAAVERTESRGVVSWALSDGSHRSMALPITAKVD